MSAIFLQYLRNSRNITYAGDAELIFIGQAEEGVVVDNDDYGNLDKSDAQVISRLFLMVRRRV